MHGHQLGQQINRSKHKIVIVADFDMNLKIISQQNNLNLEILRIMYVFMSHIKENGHKCTVVDCIQP